MGALSAMEGDSPLPPVGQPAAEMLSRDDSGSSGPEQNLDAHAAPDGLVSTPGTEVFVGGLPSDSTDEAVRAAFQAVGPVVSVRLTRRKRGGECKGFGFVKYADPSTADRACTEIKEACGKEVSVHISRGKAAEEAFDSQDWPLQDDADPDASINRLLQLLRSHADKRSAVEAALRAVHAVPGNLESPDDSDPLKRPGRARAEVDVPDPATLIDAFPHCKRLLDTFRASPNTQNKTPLAILHEYATRFMLELTYDEKSESALGPFTSEAKLTSVGGAVLYAKGTGRGRGKKDAKQVAAAALLEELLKSVDMAEFLQPGKSKQQLPVRLALHPSLVHMHRGRGRMGGSRGGYMRALSRGYYPHPDYLPGHYDPLHYADHHLPLHYADPHAAYRASMGPSAYDYPPSHVPAHAHQPLLHQAALPREHVDALGSLHMGSRGTAVPELLHHPSLQDSILPDAIHMASTFGLTEADLHHHSAQPDSNGFGAFRAEYGNGGPLDSLPASTRSYASHQLTLGPETSPLLGLSLSSGLPAGHSLGSQLGQYQRF